MKWIKVQAAAEAVRLTAHAQQEMVAEEIDFDEVLQAIANDDILENYSKHQRGACCLLFGITNRNRPLQIVCTTSGAVLIIITVYVPKQPKWITPTQRRQLL